MKNFKKEITFTNILGKDLNLFPPVPAIKTVEDWYIKTPDQVTAKKEIFYIDQKISTSSTIKKCMPIFDSMTSGYIFFTQTDISITRKDNVLNILWPSGMGVDYHSIAQAELHPKNNKEVFVKILNPYAIKTPIGYSTLFVNPLHKNNKFFTILEGIVDTDKYISPIHFPGVLNDLKFEGIIPAGTPIAQAIPFKRDSWQHRIGSEKDVIKASANTEKLKSFFFNSYKKQFWSKKEYK